MGGAASGEGVNDDGSGDALVGGDRQGVAGVVVDPGEDFCVGAIREAVVGEVGLPGFVGLFGFESDVGGAGLLLGLVGDTASGAEVPVDGRCGDRDVVVVLEVPAGRGGSGVQACERELVAKVDDEFHHVGWGATRRGSGSS